MEAIIPTNRAPVHLEEDEGHSSLENIALTLLVTKVVLDTIQTDNFLYGAFTGLKYGVFVLAREAVINWAIKLYPDEESKHTVRKIIVKASSMMLGLGILSHSTTLPEPFRLGVSLIIIAKGTELVRTVDPRFKAEYMMGIGLGIMGGAVM